MGLCCYQITMEGHGLPSPCLLGESRPLSKLEAFPVRDVSCCKVRDIEPEFPDSWEGCHTGLVGMSWALTLQPCALVRNQL